MHPDHSVAITGNTVALNRFILEVELKPGPNEPASDEAGPEGSAFYCSIIEPEVQLCLA